MSSGCWIFEIKSMNTSVVSQKISADLPQKLDYLLLCASFEDRCLSMYEYLDQNNVSKAGIFYFEQFLESSSKNINKLKSKFNAESYKLDYSSPTSIADSVMSFLSNMESNQHKPNIAIDISTFTRESLLIILRYLVIKKDSFSNIYIFYRFASVSPYLSDGVVSIRSVLGYMGNISINKPTHLILLSGFEYGRAREIIDILEPDFLSIGYGGKNTSITSDLYKLNLEFTRKLMAYYSSEYICKFEYSLKDPISVKKEILNLASSKPEYNTLVTPLNNKVSTVGVALAAIENSNIQLIYAQMAEYNESNYSQVKDDCLIFDLTKLI